MKPKIILISFILLILSQQSLAQGRFCQSVLLNGPPLPSTMPFSLQFTIPPSLVYDMGYNVYYENSAPGVNNISIVIIGDGVFVLDQFDLMAGSGSYINNSLNFPSGSDVIIDFTINTGVPPSTTIDVFQFQICSSFDYSGGSNISSIMALDSYPTPPSGLFNPFLYAMGQFSFVIGIIMIVQNLEMIGKYDV